MKTAKKILTVFMAVIICILPLAPAASAVTYPAGVSKTTVQGSMNQLDKLLSKLVSSGDTDIKTSVYSMLCSDKSLNAVFSAVYSEIAGNENTLSSIGVNVSPSGLASALSAYPQVSKKLAACKNLTEAVAASESFVWGVSGREPFAKAVAAMFAPFNEILFVLLCSGSISVNNYIAIKGANGYTNAIITLFEALECPNIMTQENFTATAKADRYSMVKQIVYMLYYSIDAILEQPVNGISSVLPHVAWYLQSGKLSESLTTLVNPLSVRVGIFTIPGISSLFSGISNLESETDLSSMLKDIDASALLGSDVKLTLPDIDLEALAACGTDNGDGTYTSDKADALITILNWLLDAVRLNKSALAAQLGDAAETIDKLLAKDNATLIKAIYVLLAAGNTPRNKIASYTYPATTPAEVAMPGELTRDNIETVVSGMDDLITEILQESDPEANIEATLKTAIYCDKTLGSIMTMLYTALDNEEYSSVIGLLGIETSPAGAAATLSAYSSVARALRNAKSWKDVKAESLSFGIKAGDRQSFRVALTAVLKPFAEVLGFLFAGDTLAIADAVEIKGTNGYATVVIPLLEALGCDNQTIVAYSGYGRTDEAIITDIIDPILALVDKICASPVEMLCTILPNIVYFLNSGILPDMVKNLLYPVTSLLDDAGLSDIMPADMFSGLSSLNINEIFSKLDLSSLGLSIKLPEADIASLANLGTPENRISKMSADGSSVSYTYILADRPAVMTTLLRYLVDALKLEENSGMLSSVMSGFSSGEEAEAGAPDMMSAYAGNIAQRLNSMTTDEVIVWLYNLFFRETPDVEIEEKNEVIPHIIYKPDRSLPGWAVALILVGIVVLALFVIWVLLKLGYLEGLQTKLDKRRHRREKKKQNKQKEKQRIAMEKAKANTNIVYSSELDGAGRKGMQAAGVSKKEAPRATTPASSRPATNRLVDKTSSPDTIPVAQSASAKPTVQKKPEVQKKTADTAKKSKTQYSYPNTKEAQRYAGMSDRQAAAMARREEKAAMKALKDTKKADKFYQQALGKKGKH